MKRFKIAVILTIFMMLVYPFTALATVDTPTDYAIYSATGYRNLLETGDMGFLVAGNLNYTVNPSGYTASQLFLIRLRSGSGSDIRTVTPVSYYDSGFQYFGSFVYFTAAEVTALSLSWGDTTLSVQIIGNPSYLWTVGIPPSAEFTPLTWDGATTAQQLSTNLGNAIVAVASQAETYWGGITNYVKLTYSNAGVTQLTATYTGAQYFGESYFNQIWPYFNTVCPQIYLASTTNPTPVKSQGSMSYFMGLENRLVGTPFDMTGLANNFHLPRIMLSTMVWLVLTAIIAGKIGSAVGNMKVFGVIIVSLIPAGTLLGFVSAVFCAAIIVGAFILLILTTVFNRA